MSAIVFALLSCLVSLSACQSVDDALFGHMRDGDEPGLNAESLAALTSLFRDEWRNESLLPEYEHSLLNVRCPKTRGRPYTIWCDAAGNVVRLSLHAPLVHGALLPPSLLRLTHLHTLELVSFRGAAPSPLDALAALTKLAHLTVAHTDALVGPLHGPALAQLSSLAELHLAECANLNGAIPTEIGLLTNLEKLALFRNALDSTLPSQLGRLTDLLHLYTFQNRLVGRVPAQLAALTDLVECRLQRSMRVPHADNNAFHCPLPHDLPGVCEKQTAFRVLCHERAADSHSEL
jgi:hypothetical protein